jgi:hypothetical protein
MSTPVRHDHEHAGHTHEHGAHEHAAAEVAPASNDNLILDIGADTGALIIHAAAYRDQAEVEISPAGSPRALAHNIVRRRETVGGATYAAVFPALAAGDYIIWRDAQTDARAGTVTIRGGTVASFRLDR